MVSCYSMVIHLLMNEFLECLRLMSGHLMVETELVADLSLLSVIQ